MTTVYDFSINKQNGEATTLADYKDQVLLIVNTATGCGLTPQYEGLQKLYDDYKDKGFTIIDFPCNQFKQQAPGSADEINTFCSLNYNTTFPRFEKINVNGKDAHPLYKWMKEEAKGPFGKVVEWNFSKFLVDREGNVIKRFASKTDPHKIASAIEELL